MEETLPWKVEEYWMETNSNQVGKTTPLSRSRLQKESLMQRLVEIEKEIMYLDMELDKIYNNNTKYKYLYIINL